MQALAIASTLVAFILLLVLLLTRNRRRTSSSSALRLHHATSVNYHFTRQCNYACKFCFHTDTTSFVLPMQDAKRGLKLLRDYGVEKINFSGGEPFLQQGGNFVGEMVRYCKLELGFPSVSIVSNGSRIREDWFKTYGEHLDILAISCDSFDDETNIAIGRGLRHTVAAAAHTDVAADDGLVQRHPTRDSVGRRSTNSHVDQMMRIREWCNKYKVLFKINTVVNQANKDEDMSERILQLRPVRWKVFQCLLLDGENSGQHGALRDARSLLVSAQEFETFLDRHRRRGTTMIVPEGNTEMRDSYLILNEYMQFLDCTSGAKIPSPSILDVGVHRALDGAGFDAAMFDKRGGRYKWSKRDVMDVEDAGAVSG